ncbi:MAG TPA: mechanosensitive ion channel family protein [Steroidobacteraceae bacterium]|nr:mechanosensitive ion channel family protein [Steroidobacteraceae bacterium]
MLSWEDIWQTGFLWNSVGQWVRALLAFLVTFTVLPLVKGYIGSQRRKWRQAGRELPLAIEVAAMLVDRTSKLFLFTIAVAFAFTQLEFPSHIEDWVRVAIVLTFWFQVGLWGMSAVRFAIDKRARKGGGMDPSLASSIDIIVFVAGLTIWAMAFLLALDNLGVEIKPLLAGLGIGGIAVALAVQTVLSDLLASMSIALDKPFTLGDSLQVDDINGTVEHIGVKSTRLRSVSGEQVIVSNADILKSRLRNNGRMRERRSAFTLNIVYNTPLEKLRAIPGVIQEIVMAQPKTRFDRCHFLSYGDWALRFEVVYFVTVPEFNVYADIQQKVNLEIFERFEKMGVEFAFPSRPYDPELHATPRLDSER